MSLSAARSRVSWARDHLSTNRVDDVAPLLDAAENFLAGLDDAEKAPLLAEIAAVRAELDNTPSSDDERFLAAARNQLRHARGEFDNGRDRELVEQSLDKAAEYLGDARERFRAPLLAEIEHLRAQLGGAAAQNVPTQPVVTTITDDEEHRTNVNRASTRVVRARSLVESQATEGVQDVLAEALGFLAEVPDGMKAELLTQIDEIRVHLAAAERAEAIRDVSRGLDIHLTAVDSAVDYENWMDGRKALSGFHERFAREDVMRVLPAEVVARYQERAADRTIKVAAGIKAEQLDRALSLLAEIDEKVAGDPLAGQDRRSAYTLVTDVAYLKQRVLRELDPVPADDPAVRAVRARLDAADEKVALAAGEWERATLRQQATSHWNAVRDDVDGWQGEALDTAPPSLYSPNLPRTHHAVRHLRYLLEDAETQRIRAENPDDETIQTIYRAADEMLTSAAAKLNAGFARILAHAEAMPTPMREDDLHQTLHLQNAARSMLEGTQHAQPMLDRIAELDTRWRTDYAQEMQARKALYEKLSVQADTIWPGIVAAAGAVADFDPSDTAGHGRTVLLSQVHNRCGWKWSGPEYGFAMRYQGTIVAGVFEPHVLAALEHAWYDLKLDVNDRIPWDLVAVVDGQGTIGERTERTLRHANTGEEIGKVEEWPLVACLRLRVVGLHAGPVAVGPLVSAR